MREWSCQEKNRFFCGVLKHQHSLCCGAHCSYNKQDDCSSCKEKKKRFGCVKQRWAENKQQLKRAWWAAAVMIWSHLSHVAVWRQLSFDQIWCLELSFFNVYNKYKKIIISNALYWTPIIIFMGVGITTDTYRQHIEGRHGSQAETKIMIWNWLPRSALIWSAVSDSPGCLWGREALLSLLCFPPPSPIAPLLRTSVDLGQSWTGW